MSDRRRTERRSAALPATGRGASPAADGVGEGPAERRRARLALAARARDSEDLALLLEILDLHPDSDDRTRPCGDLLESGRPPGSAFPR